MAKTETPTTKGLRGSEFQAKTRLLLALWDMGGLKEGVKKGELTKRIQRTDEKAGDYQVIFEQLDKAGAIEISNNRISLSDKGVQILGEGLKSADFTFDGQIGGKTANALLRWFREMGTLNGKAIAPAVQAEAKNGAIASYDKFKLEVLALFEKLDKSYNYSGLVPIWHLRRELEQRVGREEFNDWLMEMQAQQLFYLQSGEARGATNDQKQDSINDDVRGLLFFASQPS